MILRVLALALVSVLLAGCILQSKTPLIAEAEGQLALGASPVTLAGFTLKAGTWNREDGQMVLVPEGNHYRLTDSSLATGTTGTVTFLPLANQRWLLQLSEEQKDSNYLLADIEHSDIYPSPIFCSDVFKQAAFAPLVEGEGMDCKLTAQAARADVLAALSVFSMTRKLKLSPAP